MITILNNENMTKERDDTVQLDFDLIEEIYEKHYKNFYRIAYKRTRNIEKAKDVIQNTMETVCKKMGSEQKIFNLDAWLYTILKYKCYNSFGKYNRVHYYSNDVLENYLVQKNISDIKNIDLYIALKSLSEEERKIVVCKYMYGFKISEITKFCKCSDSTVRKKLKKALNVLKNKLTE